jgi:adhesin transport system membrane fusion protein
VLQEQIHQKELEVNELTAQRKAVANNLKTTEKRFELTSSLLSKKLVPELEYLSLQSELEAQRGQLESLDASIPRAKAGITEANQRLNEAQTRFRREAQEDLTKAEEAIGRVKELLSEANGQQLRSEIKSPIDGIVKNMRYNTIGGVVKPGEPIMEIVPTGDRLVIDAKLSPVDRGYVAVGQPAVVKVTTYDFSRYGGLNGEVILVGSDSNTDPNGNIYFRVVVQTDKTYLGTEEGDLPITPGMQATVEVHTGTKSVMNYLVKPVLKLKDEAFRER